MLRYFIELLLLLALCGTSSSGNIKVRVWNGIRTQAATVALATSSGETKWTFSNVPYIGISNYSAVLNNGTYRVAVTSFGNASHVSNVSFVPGSAYTLGFVTLGNATVVQAVADDWTPPSDAASSRLRLVQWSPNISTVSVFATPIVPLINDFRDSVGAPAPLFQNVSFGDATQSIALAAQSWALSFVANGTVLTRLNVTFAGGGVYTVVLFRAPNNATVAASFGDISFVFPTLRLCDFDNASSPIVLVTDTGVQQTPVGPSISYGQLGPYLSPAVPVTGNLSVMSSSAAVVSSIGGSQFVGSSTATTCLALAGGRLSLLRDDGSAPSGRDSARLRFVHAAFNVSAVDFWLDALLVFRNVSFGLSSQYATLPAGTYHLRLFPTGNESLVLFDVPLFTLQPGNVTTAVAAGVSGVSMLATNTDATYAYLHVAFANAVSDSAALSVSFDGIQAFSGVPFGSVAGYVDVPFLAASYAGWAMVTVVDGSGTVVYALNETFVGGDSFTLALAGLRNAQMLETLVLVDDVPVSNTTATNAVLVRLGHFMVNAPPAWVTVSYDDVSLTLAANLSYGETLDWLALAPASSPVNDYRFQYMDASQNLLLYYHVLYLPGQAYTLFGEGTSAPFLPSSFANHLVVPMAYFRVLNAGPPVDVIVNGLVRTSNLTGSTGFQPFPAKVTYEFDLVTPNTIYPVLANVSGLAYPPRSNTTLFVFPPSPFFNLPTTIKVASDAGLLPQSNQTQVRFVHASEDLQVVEVLIDGVIWVPELSFLDVGGHLTLPVGTHSIDLWYSQTTESVFSMTAYFSASTMYTIVFEGPVASLHAVTFVDAGPNGPAPPPSPTGFTTTTTTSTSGRAGPMGSSDWMNGWTTIKIAVIAAGGAAGLIIAGTLVGCLLYRRHKQRSEYQPLY
eukprot:TRINITY_DN18542_c0_g1_i1.p1 TRINITY_DN18542_c0_g1~~TRINITY_DN18542_c0_g1_i1.p1  ORF type:complete len:903 (-),score=254.58 TRINITY_DN18542_c0_g1_i1:154-2862(-)